MMGEIVTLIAVPLVRGIAGWAEKALHDGKVTALEWKKLAETVLRIGCPAVALCYGLNMPVEYAVCIPFVVDYGYHYINKILKKLKK